MIWMGGERACPRCGGAGCYACDRTGKQLRCPQCGDVDSQGRHEGNVKCGVCGTVYHSDGDIRPEDQEDSDNP